METLELYQSILSDIGNFVLVIFGFSVTLFTVLYSFIIAKREQLKEYSDRIKTGSTDPLHIQRHSNALKFIKRFKRFNMHLVLTIFIDLGTYLSCMAIKYFINSEYRLRISTYVLITITVFILVYVVTMLVITVRDYLKITKI